MSAKIRNNRWFTLGLAVASVLLLTMSIRPLGRAAYAAAVAPIPTGMYGTPTQFVVTVNSCAVSTDGTTFIDIFTTPVSFDVASVSSGQQAVSFTPAAVLLPAGTYTTVRCVISTTVQLTATVANGTDLWTTNAGEPFNATNNGTPGSISVTDPSGPTTVFPVSLMTPLVVAPGPAKDVRVSFDLTNAVELFSVGGGLAILPSSSGFSVTIALVP